MANYSEGAKGALGGAATGAAIGSVIPGIGTAIGALGGGAIGGLAGLFGDEEYKTDPRTMQLQNAGLLRGYGQQGLEQAINGRGVPMADRSGEAAFRNAQLGLMSQLQRQASGQQVGPGELAVNRQVGQGMAAQMGQAAASRGFGGAASALNAQRAMQGITGAGAGQAAMAGLQDRSQAQSMLGQLTQAGRSAEQNLSLADQAAALRARGMDDQAIMGYMSAMMGMDQAELNARMQAEGYTAQQQMSQPGMLPTMLQAGAMAAQYRTGAA